LMQRSPPAIPSGLRIPDGMVSEGLALVCETEDNF
jgi:hypothetical protein